MGAFAMAMREGRFSRQSHGPLAECTIRGTISHTSSSFRDNDHPNQAKDEDCNLGRVVSRLSRAFRNKDSNLRQQKSLPVQVLIMMTREDKQKLSELLDSWEPALSFGQFLFVSTCKCYKPRKEEQIFCVWEIFGSLKTESCWTTAILSASL